MEIAGDIRLPPALSSLILASQLFFTRNSGVWGLVPSAVRAGHSTTNLPTMPQIVIGQHQRHHGFTHGHGADTNAGVVAAFCGHFRFGTVAGDGFARGANGRGWFDRETSDNRLAAGDAA